MVGKKLTIPARVSKWIVVTVGALILAVIAALAVLNSPFGQRFVADRIAEIAPASGLQIEIGRIDGDLYGEATLHDVVLSDPKGKFLEIPLVELDWRPFSWFTSGLDVRKLVAYRGTFYRTPELLPGDEDAPILPDFDIRVDRLELVDFTAAEGVIGSDSQVVNAVLRADIRDGRAYVNARADISGEDNLAFLLDSEPDADKYDLRLDYNAPAGGFLAGMAGSSEDLRLRIFGDGTWERWNGGIYATQAGERLAAIKFTKQAETYELLGQVDPRDNLTGLPARALGPTVSLRAVGSLTDSVLEGSAQIAGAALRGEAEGAIDLADNAFDDLMIDARLTDPNLFSEGFALEGARLAATLDGAFRDLDIEHVLSVDRLAAGEYVLDGLTQSGTATWDGTRFVLPLEARAERIVTGLAQVDPRLNSVVAAGTVVYTGGRLLSDDLVLRAPGLGADLQLRGDLGTGTYRLTGPVRANGLAIENIGTAGGRARIDLQLGGARAWTLSATLDGAITEVANATLANLAGLRLDFDGNVRLGAGLPILFDDFALSGDKLSLTASGRRLANGETELAGDGRHVQYGQFTFDARLDDEGPVAELVFADPLPAAGLKDVRVALSPIEDGFDIQTSGNSLLGPFSGDLDLYAPEGGPLRLEVAELIVSDTRGEGTVEIEDGIARGMIGLTGGGLTGNIQLMPLEGNQSFSANLRADNATFGGEDPVRVSRGTVEARGVFAEGNSSIDAEIDLAGVSRGNLFLGRAEADVALRNGSGSVTGLVAGRRGSRFALNFDGRVAPERIAVALQGTYAGRRIAMPRRAVLNRLDGGGWQLARTQISYAGGSIIASGRFGTDSGTRLDLALDELPLNITDIAVADLGLGGQISGLVEYEVGTDGIPVGSARVKVEGLSRSGLVVTSRPIDLFLAADLSSSRLETRALIREDGRTRGRLQGRIANLPGDGGIADRLQRGALDAQLRYNGPASALWRLAAVELFDLTGPLEVAANFSGSLRNPSIAGSLASDDLRLQSALTGTDVDSIAVRGRFAGARLRISRFTGRAPNGGTVSGSGFIDLSGLGERLPTIDLKLAADNAQLLERDDLGATVTGPLRVVSDGIGGTIAGRVRIEQARWQLGGGSARERLPRIATREVNGRADVAPQSRRSGPWRYLIDAVADNQIEVRGLGLDSEWAANIRLRGTVDAPQIYRQATLVRGTYSFAGARFELRETSRIDFTGSNPPNPRLNIVAENDGGEVDATVSITGTAQSPQISFSSASGLSDEEVLSRLLFGDSVTDISAPEALQLGAALASLRGGGGLDPINSLRSAIGLDRLRVVGSDPTIGRGTSVAVGKYFGDRFYAELITDGRGYSATELEFRITSWLSLLASISTISGESLNLEARRDY
jgi:translocation and assembly module TamB